MNKQAIGCANKTAYRSVQHAKTGVRILREAGERVHVYACPNCGRYHVGHNRGESHATR